MKSANDRFWDKLDMSGGPDACWLWTKCCNKAGYGRFKVGGKHVLAHRFAYELTNGPIPSGMVGCHRCDNPPCCNPAHLFLGVQADNMADKAKKGRGNQPKGEQHGRVKLTETLVAEIRALYAAGGVTLRELGRRFGVGNVQILRIVRRKSWK